MGSRRSVTFSSICTIAIEFPEGADPRRYAEDWMADHPGEVSAAMERSPIYMSGVGPADDGGAS